MNEYLAKDCERNLCTNNMRILIDAGLAAFSDRLRLCSAEQVCQGVQYTRASIGGDGGGDASPTFQGGGTA